MPGLDEGAAVELSRAGPAGQGRLLARGRGRPPPPSAGWSRAAAGHRAGRRPRPDAPCQVIADSSSRPQSPDDDLGHRPDPPPQHALGDRGVPGGCSTPASSGPARLSVFRGGFDPAAARRSPGRHRPAVGAGRAVAGRPGRRRALRSCTSCCGSSPPSGWRRPGRRATRRAHAGHYAGFLRPGTTGWPTPSTRPRWPGRPRDRQPQGGLAGAGRVGRDRRRGRLLEDLWLVHRRHGRFDWWSGSPRMLQRALARDDATLGSGPGGTYGPGWPIPLGRADEGQEELRAMLRLAGRPCRRPAPAGRGRGRGAAGQARSRTLGTRPAADPAARQAAAEVAQAYAMIADLLHGRPAPPMVASGVSTINAAERAGSLATSPPATPSPPSAQGRRPPPAGRLVRPPGRQRHRHRHRRAALAIRSRSGASTTSRLRLGGRRACLGRPPAASPGWASRGSGRSASPWSRWPTATGAATAGRWTASPVAASARGRHDHLSLYWGLPAGRGPAAAGAGHRAGTGAL